MIYEIPCIAVRLTWVEPWKGPAAPHLLRGALAAAFPNNDLFHQHDATGADIYRYPRIQYRWDTQTGDGLVFGFGNGVDALLPLFNEDIELRLGSRLVRVREAKINFRQHKIEMLSRLQRYRLRSPWLPLNQKNFDRYQKMSRDEQESELDRIAVANILSAFKGLDIRLENQVYAAVLPRRKVSCQYKDQHLLGFLGTFATNVSLPNDFALGKAVSHGYGWLQQKDCPS